MNEWVAFGIVAVICGLLAWLVSLRGNDSTADGDASERDDTRSN